MILLTSGTDIVSVITASGVTTVRVHASWIDNVNGTITPGATTTLITGAVATPGTTVVAGPSSGQRNVKSLVIFEDHPTSSNLITVCVTNASVLGYLFKYTLLAGETLQYYDTLGFQVVDAAGGLKLTPLTGRLRKLTAFTTTGAGTLTTAVDTTTIRVRMVGGGGGGAGVAANNNNMAVGSGGAGGGYTEFTAAVTPNTGYSLNVGASGAGGANNANGANGTNSNFTVSASLIYTAQGGANGQNMANGATAVNGVGGVLTPANTANSPQLSATGGQGGAATRANGMQGMTGAGGVSVMGPGVTPVWIGLNSSGSFVGVNAGNYGGGGSGGGSSNGNANGGAGANGVILVEEYS